MQIGADMIKGVVAQSVIANVDWLALTVRFENVVDWEQVPAPSQHRFRILGGTAVWLRRILLVNETADKVATILAEPRNHRMFAPNVGLVEVANEWLYHGRGWEYIIFRLQQVVPFEVLGISRADLCADFNPTLAQRDIIMGLSQSRYYVQGKMNGAGFWSITPPVSAKANEKQRRKALASHLAPWAVGDRVPHSQSWGHKTSEVKWKVYYKSRELVEVEDKPYIRDQWECEGLDVKDVWRLEVSLKYPHRLLLADRPITWPLFNAEWPSILRSMYQSRFTVRRNEHHADRSNDTIVDFLPALSEGGVSLRCRPSIAKSERYGRITLLRRLVKSLEDDAVLLDDCAREGCYALIESIVERDELQNYFTAMSGKELADFIEEGRVNAYSRNATC